MKEIRTPLEWFDLDGFINETLQFLEDKVDHPTLVITWVEAPGRCPNDEADESWDFKAKLLNEPVFLFFPFALPDMEGSFDCADGSSYLVTARDCYGEDEDYLGEEYDEDPEERFVIEDIVGSLLRVDGDELTANFAACPLGGCLPPPTIDLLDEGHFLEQQLFDFINGFVTTDLEIGRSSSSGSLNIEDFCIRTQDSEPKNKREGTATRSDTSNHKTVSDLSATVEELITQIMKERHLSREDAEGACRLTLGKQEHFQRVKAAILWNLDRDKRRDEKTRLSYPVIDIDLLVHATGMDWGSIFDEVFNIVDNFIFVVNQSFSKALDTPAMDEFGWREMALLKRLNLDYKKHFQSLASIAFTILDSYPRPQEAIRRKS